MPGETQGYLKVCQAARVHSVQWAEQPPGEDAAMTACVASRPTLHQAIGLMVAIVDAVAPVSGTTPIEIGGEP